MSEDYHLGFCKTTEGYLKFVFLIAVVIIFIVLVRSNFNYCCLKGACSYCYDMTASSDFEIPLEYCASDEKCNEYCENTYQTGVAWSTCCLTDGGPPYCINIQACVCKENEKK